MSAQPGGYYVPGTPYVAPAQSPSDAAQRAPQLKILTGAAGTLEPQPADFPPPGQGVSTPVPCAVAQWTPTFDVWVSRIGITARTPVRNLFPPPVPAPPVLRIFVGPKRTQEWVVDRTYQGDQCVAEYRDPGLFVGAGTTLWLEWSQSPYDPATSPTYTPDFSTGLKATARVEFRAVGDS